jgi:recombinational DNA repair protein (RecF pathway)
MQGYILNITRVKEEDLIVTLLTKNRLKTLYRFYGARHATINLGFKIDFEVQSSPKSTISMLRQVLHLSTPWLADFKKFYLWQQFIKQLYRHLRDVEEIDAFYFDLLEEISNRLSKQNPKRTLVEAYLRLLEYEGRLHEEFTCFICGEKVEEHVVVTRAFLLAHPHCLYAPVHQKAQIETLFETKQTLFLSDFEVERLWEIILEGL